MNDAQWLQKLHQFRLLRASFQPSAETAVLRTYLRRRERLPDYCSAHIQYMQKAVMQMMQLNHVVTDITGCTGMRIIRAIIAGQQAPRVLASHRDPRCKASVERITQALTGHCRPEHPFSLPQAMELYDFYQRQVQPGLECVDVGAEGWRS